MNGSPESKNVVAQLGDVTFGMACSDVVKKEKNKKKEVQYGSANVSRSPTQHGFTLR